MAEAGKYDEMSHAELDAELGDLPKYGTLDEKRQRLYDRDAAAAEETEEAEEAEEAEEPVEVLSGETTPLGTRAGGYVVTEKGWEPVATVEEKRARAQAQAQQEE